MSMLAESRRKKGWILNPKSSHWSEDQNKFGQRMLEEMGWSRGKGLGKRLTGTAEHIRPTVQSDSRGLGFQGSSDEWVAHLDDFNDLLSQLQQDQSGAGAADAATGRAKSLEERSKKSRARVHYHKFTRGKDLSRASHSDLAAILGGRAVPAASQPVTPVSSRPPTPPAHADSEPEPEAGKRDDNLGYITISSKQSVKDYFAEKMRKMKMAKVRREQETMEKIQLPTNAHEEMQSALKGTATENAHPKSKSKKKRKQRTAGDETSVSEEPQTAKAANGDIISDLVNIASVDYQLINDDNKADISKRKSKKKTKKAKIHGEQLSTADVVLVSSKKKANRTEAAPPGCDADQSADTSPLELHVTSVHDGEPENKRKRDRRDSCEDGDAPAHQVQRAERKKKKRKKPKCDD